MNKQFVLHSIKQFIYSNLYTEYTFLKCIDKIYLKLYKFWSLNSHITAGNTL